jgi:hypothetical protein
MKTKVRPQGKHVSETHGKRTVVVYNRGPRLQIKVNGAPKGIPRK